ncbi:Sporulation protein RMD1 [Schizosaccharomyces pombe]|uniref:Sad1-interacting factor 2 n=1 Tax=Schizosaccharomyces pombe (strain 972 / ATCC 24843) TaxID=284812 RepID=SIF2_SCHPO|nr:putative Sad1-interacting factor 2 [Schizosaccharomyces pombe]O74446.2 RecName: Full=Sad1-interacting factor 2; AltName: Full=Sporulation protein sif2 [Schizosaccharomyces pombe 972h-]CAA21964.3 Sad1 interacting factor 2 (predicted) [Schizosaccharomyces pombe]|eukprot:NP_587910.3 putative Sad1-interacting factor 2 [Schizosaccharomyces pombe]
MSNRIGPQRSTKTAAKLRLLPSTEEFDDFRRQDTGREVYSQIPQIEGSTAKRDAEHLGKRHREFLPRVTAYCTCDTFRVDLLFKFFQSRRSSHKTRPKQFDECIYSPYSYNNEETTDLLPDTLESSRGTLNRESSQESLQSIFEESGLDRNQPLFREVFCFTYGVVVLWGYTIDEEHRFLRELGRFEIEKLKIEDMEVEEFNYYITTLYQPRIFNDFIALRDASNYMIRLSISHAIAQSVKISLFEELVNETIDATKDTPQMIAETGRVNLKREEIMMAVGQLFILRININLQGSVLDSPELMWTEPQLEPIYTAARSYLEINQRVALLNQRVEVIGDLLSMLKEQITHTHDESLEWIVVILMGLLVLIALFSIVVDWKLFQ